MSDDPCTCRLVVAPVTGKAKGVAVDPWCPVHGGRKTSTTLVIDGVEVGEVEGVGFGELGFPSYVHHDRMHLRLSDDPAALGRQRAALLELVARVEGRMVEADEREEGALQAQQSASMIQCPQCSGYGRHLRGLGSTCGECWGEGYVEESAPPRHDSLTQSTNRKGGAGRVQSSDL